MPSLSTLNLPVPTDDKEFERLLTDYSSAKFEISASLWGRKGQKQDGIDIFATLPNGSLICVQCKDYRRTKITTKFLDDCIAEAEKGGLPISHFVIALGCERDAKLQKHIVQANIERVNQKKFSVELVFWDDIQHFVKLNKNILSAYYPEFYVTSINEYSELILSEDDLRLSFLNLLVKYKIEDFLTIEIFITGVYTWQIEAYENFYLEVKEILMRAAAITSTQTYKNISEFMGWSNAFCNLITLKVHTDDGLFARVINPFYIQDRPKIEKSFKIFRDLAEKLLLKIK